MFRFFNWLLFRLILECSQVVWAKTNLVGCGFSRCRDVQGVWGRGHRNVFVCHYNPQGNTVFVTGRGQLYAVRRPRPDLPSYVFEFTNPMLRLTECSAISSVHPASFPTYPLYLSARRDSMSKATCLGVPGSHCLSETHVSALSRRYSSQSESSSVILSSSPSFSVSNLPLLNQRIFFQMPAFTWATDGNDRCSHCPANAPACYQGLCYMPKNYETTTTSTTTTTTEEPTTTSYYPAPEDVDPNDAEGEGADDDGEFRMRA